MLLLLLLCADSTQRHTPTPAPSLHCSMCVHDRIGKHQKHSCKALVAQAESRRESRGGRCWLALSPTRPAPCSPAPGSPASLPAAVRAGDTILPAPAYCSALHCSALALPVLSSNAGYSLPDLDYPHPSGLVGRTALPTHSTFPLLLVRRYPHKHTQPYSSPHHTRSTSHSLTVHTHNLTKLEQPPTPNARAHHDEQSQLVHPRRLLRDTMHWSAPSTPLSVLWTVEHLHPVRRP